MTLVHVNTIGANTDTLITKTYTTAYILISKIKYNINKFHNIQPTLFLKENRWPVSLVLYFAKSWVKSVQFVWVEYEVVCFGGCVGMVICVYVAVCCSVLQ